MSLLGGRLKRVCRIPLTLSTPFGRPGRGAAAAAARTAPSAGAHPPPPPGAGQVLPAGAGRRDSRALPSDGGAGNLRGLPGACAPAGEKARRGEGLARGRGG